MTVRFEVSTKWTLRSPACSILFASAAMSGRPGNCHTSVFDVASTIFIATEEPDESKLSTKL